MGAVATASGRKSILETTVRAANLIFAGPATGADALPTFRALVAPDYVTMVGDAGTGGVKGAVPAPASGDAAAGKYLKADGTWAVPPGGSSAPIGATYITQTPDGTLTNEFALSSLSTGLLKVTTGTGALATASASDVPDLSSTYSVTGHNHSGTYAPVSHVHAATDITSSQLALARGGTGADLSGTGAGFLKQASVGATVTVGGIASGDLTTALTTPPTIGGTTPAAGYFSSLGVGITAPATELHVCSSLTSSPRGIMTAQYNTGTDGARLHMRKARGTLAIPIVVVSGDMLGKFVASGYDGTNYLEMGSIAIECEGTIGNTRVPTRLVFSTATDAAPSVLTERMRIGSGGHITASAATGTTAMQVTSASNDATRILDLISVSTSRFYVQSNGFISFGGCSATGGAITAGSIKAADGSTFSCATHSFSPGGSTTVRVALQFTPSFTPTATTNTTPFTALLVADTINQANVGHTGDIKHIHIAPTLTAVHATNHYGLFINAITGGTNNYAIYADGGDVFLNCTKFGVYGVAAVARPAAYTQTYSTASRIVNPASTAAFTGQDNAQAGTVYAKFNDLEALRGDLLQLAQVINSMIDDRQADGLAQ